MPVTQSVKMQVNGVPITNMYINPFTIKEIPLTLLFSYVLTGTSKF